MHTHSARWLGRSRLRSLVLHMLTCFTARPAYSLLALLVAACAADPDGTSTAVSYPAETNSQDAQTVISALPDAGVAPGATTTTANTPASTVQPRDPDVCGGV